jgi:hypothetical protein
MRHLKVLGVAMIAAFALTAVAAASAFAAPEFKSEIAEGAITGTQMGSSSFTAGSNGTITCTSGMFRGMITSKSTPTQATSDEASPATGKGIEYGGCKFLGFINVTVNPNGCQYTFHAATPNTTAGTADVTPNSGTCASTGITFTAAGCTIQIFPQTGINNIEYRNIGAGTAREINLIPSSTNIKYTAGSGCLAPGSGTAGTYSNPEGTTITGATATPITEKSTMKGIWVE